MQPFPPPPEGRIGAEEGKRGWGVWRKGGGLRGRGLTLLLDSCSLKGFGTGNIF